MAFVIWVLPYPSTFKSIGSYLHNTTDHFSLVYWHPVVNRWFNYNEDWSPAKGYSNLNDVGTYSSATHNQ